MEIEEINTGEQDHVGDKHTTFRMMSPMTSDKDIPRDNEDSSSTSSRCSRIGRYMDYQRLQADYLNKLATIIKAGDVFKLNALVNEVGTDDMLTIIRDQEGKRDNFLHSAVLNGQVDIVNTLLNCGSDLVSVTDDNKNTLLHVASSTGNLDIVQDIVHRGAYLNSENKNRQTPLHLACTHNRQEIANFLFKNGADITIHDSTYLTPLQVAINHDSFDTLLTLLRCMVASHQKHQEEGAEIKKWAAANNKAPALNKILQSEIRFPRLTDVDIMDFIMDAVKNRHIELVMVLLRWSNESVVHHTDAWGNTPLHYAAEIGHTVVVLELIKARADVNAKNSVSRGKQAPLHLAAGNGWTRTASILLKSHAHVDQRDQFDMTPLHHACINGQLEMVKMLLYDKEVDCFMNTANVVTVDVERRTCLDHAIDHGHEDVAKMILRHSKWRELMCVSSLDEETNYRTTPMRKLIQSMPAVAKIVLDRCITVSGDISSSKSKGLTLEFYYEFLEDAFSSWITTPEDEAKHLGLLDEVYRRFSSLQGTRPRKGSCLFHRRGHLKRGAQPYIRDPRERIVNHPLQIMATLQRESLLDHPVVTTYLYHKWSSVGRYAFVCSLVLYVLFLVMLTGFIIVMPPSYYVQFINRTVENPDAVTWFADGDGRWIERASRAKVLIFDEYFGSIFIITLSALNLCREILQMAYQRLNYFKSPINYLELFLYTAAIMFTLPRSNIEIVDDGHLIHQWRWPVGAVSGFLAWINLVLFMRKSSLFGIYVIMFIDITRTFLKFSLILFMFVMAFGLTFYALLMNQNAFRTLGDSIAKTIVMMLGELEFNSIFFGQASLEFLIPSLDPVNAGETSVNLVALTKFFFLLFIILMPILMMNMLVGLAVDNIQAIQAKANLHRLTMQVDMVMELQGRFPLWVWRSSVVCRKSFVVDETKFGKWMQQVTALRKELKKAISICNNRQLSQPRSGSDRIKDITVKVREAILEMRELYGKRVETLEHVQNSQKGIHNRLAHLEDNMKNLLKKVDTLFEKITHQKEETFSDV